MPRPITLAAFALILLLSGCSETKEEAEARLTQFNGKTLAQVSTVIGNPISQDKDKAMWHYKNSYTQRVPIQHYINGKWVTYAYRTEYIDVNCTYTAVLAKGRVKTSSYEGNSCRRFAPKLPKKK